MGRTITCNYILQLRDDKKIWEISFHRWRELKSSIYILLRASKKSEGIFYIISQTKTAERKIKRELEKAGLLYEKLSIDGDTFSLERDYIKLRADVNGDMQYLQ